MTARKDPQQIVMTGGQTLSPASDLSRYELRVGPPPIGRLRLFVHGRVAVGKTSFACSFPKTAVLEFEHKAIDPPVVGEGTKIFYARTPQEWLSIINMLVAMKANPDTADTFDTVVFDTMPTWLRLVRAKLTYDLGQRGKLKGLVDDVADYGQKGHGWSLVAKATTDPLSSLYSAGYGWIAMSHLRPGTEEDPEERSALTGKVIEYLFAEADASGYLDLAKEVGSNKEGQWEQRMVRTLNFLPANPNLPARSPLRSIDTTITLGNDGFASFKDAYDRACSNCSTETPTKE